MDEETKQRIKKLEGQIENLEDRIEDLESQLASHRHDSDGTSTHNY